MAARKFEDTQVLTVVSGNPFRGTLAERFELINSGKVKTVKEYAEASAKLATKEELKRAGGYADLRFFVAKGALTIGEAKARRARKSAARKSSN